MRWLLAIVAALILSGVAVWWMDRGSDRHALHAGEPHHARTHDRETMLYRWVDAGGVVNITDRPPSGRRSTIVRIDSNRNIVPMSDRDSASKAATTH